MELTVKIHHVLPHRVFIQVLALYLVQRIIVHANLVITEVNVKLHHAPLYLVKMAVVVLSMVVHTIAHAK